MQKIMLIILEKYTFIIAANFFNINEEWHFHITMNIYTNEALSGCGLKNELFITARFYLNRFYYQHYSSTMTPTICNRNLFL